MPPPPSPSCDGQPVRRRISSPRGEKKRLDSNIPQSSSFEHLPSSTFHQALHPSSSSSSQHIIQQHQQQTIAVSSDGAGSLSKKRLLDRKNNTTCCCRKQSSTTTSGKIKVLFKSKFIKGTRLSTLFISGTLLFAIWSTYTLHNLATRSSNNSNINNDSSIIIETHHTTSSAAVGIRGWDDHLVSKQSSNRNKRTHSNNKDATIVHHPRIFIMTNNNLPESSIMLQQDDYKFITTFWTKLYWLFPFLHRLRISSNKINDPMLHHDGWKPSPRSSSVIQQEQERAAAVQEEEEEAEQCVPMASWQTTSYPNCNSIHEIDLVRSSGPGSYTFPNNKQQQLHNTNNQYHRRRSISTYPPSLQNYMFYLHTTYPSNKSSRANNAKFNARGLMKEESIEFLGQGWFRGAWEMYVESIPEYVDDDDDIENDVMYKDWGYEEYVVLKTLRIERDFLEEYYELHRRDALAMERLTFSPYVLDIYGYCGQSAINELANFGIEGMSSLEKVARSFRGMEDIEPVSKIKLQLASMVAAGVSHMHSIDYPDFPQRYDDDPWGDGPKKDVSKKKKSTTTTQQKRITPNATLVHYDLNPRNIAIIKRGKPKLNDFNVAEFLKWDTKNNRTCGFEGRFREPWWRAPEEMQAHLPEEYPNPQPLTEKIDIYSLGNILWDILTTHSPRGKMTKDRMDKTRPKVAKGELPPWPDDFNQTKLLVDPALMAIEKAMKKCLRVKPEDRPTAGEIADELSQAIENLPEGFGDKEKWKQEQIMKEGKSQ